MNASFQLVCFLKKDNNEEQKRHREHLLPTAPLLYCRYYMPVLFWCQYFFEKNFLMKENMEIRAKREREHAISTVQNAKNETFCNFACKNVLTFCISFPIL